MIRTQTKTEKRKIIIMPYEDKLTPARIDYEQKLESPSNYTKKKQWYDRSQYANILRGLISSQLTQYKREQNRIKKTRISQNVGYLLQVMNSMIKDEKQIEERIVKLEELAGIAKKGVITK